MSTGETSTRVRQGVGLFEMEHRGLLEVTGSERVRWLDGMISGDVAALEAAGSGAGCYATLLTNRGAIVADLHVARIEESFLIECLRSELPRIRETLDRFIIADDVELADRSEDYAAFGLEGPGARALLERVLSGRSESVAGGSASELPAAGLPAADQWCALEIVGHPGLIAAFGFSGEEAYQIRVAVDARAAFVAAVEAAAGDAGIVRGDRAVLELLRVEAGIPALDSELDGRLPPEARLERAISTTKGCYVGQEIVARLRARGQVNHLLVGLRFDADATSPALGSELLADGRRTGEVTSVADSPSLGPIALAYVRRAQAEAGTRVEFEGGAATVASLPFVGPGAATGDGQDSRSGNTPSPATASADRPDPPAEMT